MNAASRSTSGNQESASLLKGSILISLCIREFDHAVMIGAGSRFRSSNSASKVDDSRRRMDPSIPGGARY